MADTPQQPPQEPVVPPTPPRRRIHLTRATWFRALAISLIVLGVTIAAVSGYVYYQAVKTFEVRRFSLPTRIYTDVLPLAPGARLQLDDLREKLDRLGYRESAHLEKAGDYNIGPDGAQIFLRGFRHPSGNHEAQQVSVSMSGGAIANVTSTSGPVTNAALEPELLTSILSEQLENRSPVTLDQVPQSLTDAVVVTEDVRFWKHPGVDPIGLFRALFRNVKAGGVSEGGSTLTQQLVKNYYLTPERSFRRKAVEAFMSVILDAKYSKREILEAYLNDIYLGRNRSISIVGVGEASRFYFGKPVSELTVPQSALLAGMIRSPNNYSPFADPERAKARRATVLMLMLKNKKIDQKQYDEAINSPLPTKPNRKRNGLGSIPFYVDRVIQELQRDYGIDDVKGRGLNIYTAIDLGWQDDATRQLEAGLQNLERSSRRLRRSENPLQGVMLGVDVGSAEIRALVGGRNYDISQFNRVLSAKRLVGSLFKPFVYLSAFEPSLSNQNITPATLVNDTRFVLKRKFSADWSPRNYENYEGIVTVRRALEHSLNAASVRIGLSVGTDAIVKTAKALGVETTLEENPSMILGAVGVPPIEMAQAYTTLARMGVRVPLHAVRYVTDEKGRMINGARAEPTQVFPARDVYLVVNVMEGVVDRGTAAGARSLGFRKRAAGKTGTTNDKRDAWFIGFTPTTLALTWVGFDDNTPTGLSGGEGAVPIWTRFMKDVTANDHDAEFAPPPNVVFAAIDELSGGLATPYCPSNVVANQAFKAGTEPHNACPTHSIAAPPPLPIDQMPMTDTTMTDTAATFPTQTLSPDVNTAPPISPGEIPPSLRQPRPDNPQQPPPTDTGAPPPTDTSSPPTSTST